LAFPYYFSEVAARQRCRKNGRLAVLNMRESSGSMEISQIQEQLATLYLRLNGYFVSGFIAHAPHEGARTNRTQVDALAVRFPYNSEPERGVTPSEYLQTSTNLTDILICEVKGGRALPRFNPALRNDVAALRSVLRWVGAFGEAEIDMLIDPLREAVTPNERVTSATFPTVTGPREFQLRLVLFAPDRPPPGRNKIRYIHGEELIGYVWRCLREGAPRPECAMRYDFGLWGPYETLIRFFKETPTRPSMQEIYEEVGRAADEATEHEGTT
jgi:hypothetical protein